MIIFYFPVFSVVFACCVHTNGSGLFASDNELGAQELLCCLIYWANCYLGFYFLVTRLRKLEQKQKLIILFTSSFLKWRSWQVIAKKLAILTGFPCMLRASFSFSEPNYFQCTQKEFLCLVGSMSGLHQNRRESTYAHNVVFSLY